MKRIETSIELDGSDEEVQKKLRQLEERVKELTCLYTISSIIEKRLSVEDTYREVLNVIPDAWQYPEITCSRITFNDSTFTTKYFRETPWKIRSSIKSQGEQIGYLDVFYLEERPEADEGPFLKEERYLIDQITWQLGNVFRLKKAEEDLKVATKKENHLNLVINRSPAIAFLWNEGEKYPVEFVSDNIRQLGYIPEDFTSGNLDYADIIHPDDVDDVLSDFSMHESKMLTDFTKEYRILTSHGDTRWVEEDTFIEYDMEGNLVNYHGIVLDITDRKKIEQTQQEHTHFLQELIDTIPAPVFYKNRDGYYIGCNRAFEKFVGLEKKDIIGRTVYEVSPPNLAEIYYQKDRELINGGDIQNYETSVRYADGTLHDVIFNKAAFNDISGKCSGLIGVILDITERKKAELLSKENEELNQIAQMKELFTDILTHDLMNPAGVIKGFTEVLLEAEEDESKAHMLKKIERNNHKLIEIVETTSKLAKLDSTDEIKFEIKDIGPILERTVDNFSSQIEEKKMKIDLEAKEEYHAKVNPVIEEVFSNLLSNAIKYSPHESRVIIDVLDEEYCWKVEITDFGDGIEDQNKAKVFERFKRADKGGVKGTGLGLAIVKRIVELHGGNVGVEDNPHGQGSKFWITVNKSCASMVN